MSGYDAAYQILTFIAVFVGIFSFIAWWTDENNTWGKWIWLSAILYIIIFVNAQCVFEAECPSEVNHNLPLIQVKNAKDFTQFTPTIVGKLGHYTFSGESRRSQHYFSDTKFTESYYPAGWRGFLWFPERCEYKSQPK